MDEYIVINIIEGKVSYINPRNANTDSAMIKPNQYLDLAGVLNKMAEYDYELVPGIVVPQNDLIFNLVMRRQK